MFVHTQNNALVTQGLCLLNNTSIKASEEIFLPRGHVESVVRRVRSSGHGEAQHHSQRAMWYEGNNLRFTNCMNLRLTIILIAPTNFYHLN